MNTHQPMRIAHRGARDEAPENTRSAFEQALAYPIDGIELDVQLSADDTAFIYHDPTLFRVTGRRFRVHHLTRGQLEQVDWGNWYDARFAGEPLNTLEDTLLLFGHRTRLLIEIKSSPVDRETGRSDRLTKQVVRLLSQLPAGVPKAHIYILSFDAQVLRTAVQLAPRWRYVLNVPERNAEKIMEWPWQDMRFLHAVDVRIDRLTKKIVEWAKSNELQVFTYTCNNSKQVQKALRLGVDAILTDRPGWLTRHLDSISTNGIDQP